MGRQAARTVKRVRKAQSQTKSAHEPRTDKDRIFCERWVLTRDHNQSYRDAGFKPDSGAAIRKLKAMRPFIDKLLVKVETKVTNLIAYERADILDHMAAIGMANPQDYYETFEVKDPKTGTVLKGAALKPLDKLSRLQASAIEEFTVDLTTGRVSYRLPSTSTKGAMLKILGENTGAIKKQEAVVHNHLHMGQVPLDKLEALEAMFVQVLGPQVSREVLGLTNEVEQD